MSDPTAGNGPIIADLDDDDVDGYPDVTEAELEADDVAEASPLDDLEAELTANIAAQPTRLEVTGREGYTVAYRRDFTGKDVEKWRRRAKRGKEVDPIHFAGLVCSFTVVAIEKDGKPLDDPDAPGAVLTFGSRYLQRLYGVTSAVDAARKFFGTDGYLQSQASGVLDGAGWAEEALEADPT